MAEHNIVGRKGEKTAEKFLRSKGYRVMRRGFRTKYAELDLICSAPDGELVFVEVRTKTGEKFGSPEDTIGWDKMKRLARAAKAYASFRNYSGLYRIDAVCVVFEKGEEHNKPLRISHYENITGWCSL